MFRSRRFSSGLAKSILNGNGLNSIDDVFAIGEPLEERFAYRATRHDHREVVKMMVDVDGNEEVFYVKRQWRHRKIIPRWSEIRRGVGFLSEPSAEWRGLKIMRRAGMNAVEPWGLFHGRGGRAAIITRSAPTAFSLQDMLGSGETLRLCETRRSNLENAVVATIYTIRDKRISWRSMQARHLYPEAIGDNWKIWLIDCETVSTLALRREFAKCMTVFRGSIDKTTDPDFTQRVIERTAA